LSLTFYLGKKVKNFSYRRILFKLALMLQTFVVPQMALQAAWQPPVVVSDPITVSSIDGPVLDVTPAGNAVSVWSTPGFFATIKASSYTRVTNTWSPPVIISSLAVNRFGNDVYTAQGDQVVSINASDYAVAVWQGFQNYEDGPNFFDVASVFSSSRDSNGVWGPVQTISVLYTDPTLDIQARDASVSVNDAGLAVAVWTQNDLNTLVGRTMASFLPQGGVWSTPIAISNDELPRDEGGPSVAINQNGDAVAVWRSDMPNDIYSIYASTYNASTATWSPAILLEGPFELDFIPKTAIDSQGNALAIWTIDETGLGPIQVRSAYFKYGTGWEPSVTISSHPNSRFNYVVLDPAGNGTALWEAEGQVWASTKPLGLPWTTPQVISDGPGALNEGFMQTPLAVNPEGDVIAIFQKNGELATSFRQFGGVWLSPEFINVTNFTVTLNVGLASCGFAVGLWAEPNDETGLLAVQAAVNGNLLQPSIGQVSRCCNRFATQKRCFNILTWAPNPCFISYRIFRDGVLIATVSNTAPFRYLDPLRCKRGNFTYTISGINIYGFESVQVPVIVE
jgi:hypothetical protein